LTTMHEFDYNDRTNSGTGTAYPSGAHELSTEPGNSPLIVTPKLINPEQDEYHIKSGHYSECDQLPSL
jgi:hypothetical protein